MAKNTHFYTLTEAAKATGKDPRTIKKAREENSLSGQPIKDGDRITGWQFDPAELARFYPDDFKALETLEASPDDAAGKDTAGGAIHPQEGTSAELLAFYKERAEKLEMELEIMRKEARHERDNARHERERLHGIIERQTLLLPSPKKEEESAPSPEPKQGWWQRMWGT